MTRRRRNPPQEDIQAHELRDVVYDYLLDQGYYARISKNPKGRKLVTSLAGLRVAGHFLKQHGLLNGWGKDRDGIIDAAFSERLSEGHYLVIQRDGLFTTRRGVYGRYLLYLDTTSGYLVWVGSAQDNKELMEWMESAPWAELVEASGAAGRRGHPGERLLSKIYDWGRSKNRDSHTVPYWMD